MDIMDFELGLAVRITELVDDITSAAEAYYTGNAIMTDSEFDKLVAQLRDLDPTNPILSTPGWGFNPAGTKTDHMYGTVGSLSKYRDVGALKLNFGRGEFTVATPKLDGLSCVAYYDNYKLVKAVTRGNGRQGINVTNKYLSINPHAAELTQGYVSTISSTGTLAIRGELVMSKHNWGAFKSQYPEYKNSRNAVAGIINSKACDENQLSFVDFVPYKVMGTSSNLHNGDITYSAMLKYLSLDSFVSIPICSYKTSEYSLDEFKELIDELCEYPCDGVVLTKNATKVVDDLIECDQVAFKFEDEKAETRVDRIEWELTRTGKLAPVAHIDPVDLDGATIRRVTCFNAKYVKDNRLGPDAYVEIQRSGMVIPDIQKVTVESPECYIPVHCPSCGHELEWKGTDLVCNSPNCEGQKYSKLYNWIDRVARVKGVSWSGINEFIGIYGWDKISDIYTTSLDDALEMLQVVKGGATRARYEQMLTKLYQPIDPRDFFVGMNVKGLGWSTACALADAKVHEILRSYGGQSSSEYESFVDKLYNIPNVGYALVTEIIHNLPELTDIAQLINEFKSIQVEDQSVQSKELRYFCVTGSLAFGSRSQFCEHVKTFGWELTDIKKCEVLVTNNPDPTSSKGRKAKELGIKIMSESDFLDMVEYGE